VRVYLPDGEWRRFPGGEPYAGGRTHELVLGLDEQAVFARRGAEIPLGPTVRHTGELGAVPCVAGVWRAA
jgi:alpha-D-xyloside xylohydrolase